MRHVQPGACVSQPDRVAIEEPLEIRLHGRPFVVAMRTPGADRELAAGFLLSERVIRSADELGTIEYCGEAANVTSTSPEFVNRSRAPSYGPRPQPST